MGCLYSKPMASEDGREGLTARFTGSKRTSSDLRVSRLNSARTEEKVETGDGGKVFPIEKQLSVPARVNYYRHEYQTEKKKDRVENDGLDHSGALKRVLKAVDDRSGAMRRVPKAAEDQPVIQRVPKAAEGEQVAAGWPSWLAAAAGEAIHGWLPRRADTFEKLEKIGQGTYSSVYKARDLIHDKIVAIKRVRFDNLDPESVKFMAREIFILRRLDHPNIIKLEGLITSRTSCSLYLVFEYMEHDLTGLASLPGIKFSEPQVKCYMQQLFSGLDHCHSRGILHRDIKGSNLLIDDNGILKIADFGLATSFDPYQRVQLTSRVVTLWYRPPELLLGATHYGVAVDLWSTGCILGELCTGKPILPGKTEVEQLHKIFKLCGTPTEDYWRKMQLAHSAVFKPPIPYRRRVTETFKDLPATAVGLLETLLSLDPSHRGTAASALSNEFFTTKPFACDPSSLPKYPPSKEIDAKVQDEEKRRQATGEGRGQKVGVEKREPQDPRRSTEIYSRADSTTMMQRGPRFSTLKSRTAANRDITFSGPLVNPHITQPLNIPIKDRMEQFYTSGPLIYGPGPKKAENELGNSYMAHSRTSVSSSSGLAATGTLSGEDKQEKSGPSQPKPTDQVDRFRSSKNESERASRHESRNRRIRRMLDSQDIEEKTDAREPNLHGCDPIDEKMYLSGPLLVPSNNMDRMLKEHDRRLQEYARRARLEKSRQEKVDGQGRQLRVK